MFGTSDVANVLNPSLLLGRPTSTRCSRIGVRKVVLMSQSTSLSRARKEELDGIIERLRTRFPSVPHVTPDQLHEMQAAGKNILIVDVRTPDERAVSYVPGSIAASEYESRQEYETPATDSSTIVCCYCTIGYRSSQYAEKLRKEGVDAVNLAGSILSWTHDHLPLVEAEDAGEERPTTKVHVFGKQWELQADGYDAVYFKWPFFNWSVVSSTLGNLFK